LKEIPRAQLENWAKGAAVLHRYRKGEIVCEEGEFGSTAYYLVSGTVDIFIHNPLAHLRTHPVRNFLGRSMRRMKSFLTDDQTDLRSKNFSFAACFGRENSGDRKSTRLNSSHRTTS